MFAIEMDFLWLPFIIAVSVFVGYMYRIKQQRHYKKRILSLEDEMLRNHAEILKLQKECVTLQNALSPFRTRVVNIHAATLEIKKENSDVPGKKKANP